MSIAMRKFLIAACVVSVADAFINKQSFLQAKLAPRTVRSRYDAAVFVRPPSQAARARASTISAHAPHALFAQVSSEPSVSKPTAVYALIFANFLVFLADNLVKLPMRSLYLYHSRVAWWQPVTSLFCHGSFSHLSGNIFLLLLFGRSVEDEWGWGGLLFAFAFCGVLANLVSLVLLPANTVSIGASGAVFGLFTVSILSRLSLRDLDWRKVVEILVLGEFVVSKMLSEMRTAATGGVAGVNHVAHLAGASSGVLLVLLLRTIVDKMEGKEEVMRQLG